jgi:hypothetical protein
VQQIEVGAEYRQRTIFIEPPPEGGDTAEHSGYDWPRANPATSKVYRL